MRKFLLALFVSNTAIAAPVPKILTEALIEIHFKSGDVQTYNGEEYKVVPVETSKKTQATLDALRKQLADAKAQIKALSNKAPVEVIKEIPQPNKLNRISIQAGIGPDGVGVKEQDSGSTISPRTAPLVGVMYARKLKAYSPWSLDGQVLGGLSPKSRTVIGTVGLGYDF